MLRILHIEDDQADAELIFNSIFEHADCYVSRVVSRPGFEAALTHEVFDLIISDSSLPGFDGVLALKMAKRKFPSVPFVFCSGYLVGEKKTKMLAQGATDFFSKSDTAELVQFIQKLQLTLAA